MYVQQQQQPAYVQMQPMQQMQMQQVPMQQMPMQQMPMQQMQMQQMPMQQMQMQPMQMQQMQPMYVQPQVMVQPVMQPVIQITQPFQPLLNSGMMPPHDMSQPGFERIQNILQNIKESNVLTIKYMEPNFRGEGGFKFGIFGRDKANPFAVGYTTSKGNASIEVPDHPEPFSIVQVLNNSTTIYNLQTGQRDMFGTLGLNQGSCNGFQIAAEKGGNRVLVFQNRQFSLLFCCCCSLLYLLHFKCCTDRNKFSIVNGEGEEHGFAEFKTDEILSFRELDVSIQKGNDQEKNAFIILQSLLYMNKKVKSTTKGADVSFEY